MSAVAPKIELRHIDDIRLWGGHPWAEREGRSQARSLQGPLSSGSVSGGITITGRVTAASPNPLGGAKTAQAKKKFRDHVFAIDFMVAHDYYDIR